MKCAIGRNGFVSERALTTSSRSNAARIAARSPFVPRSAAGRAERMDFARSVAMEPPPVASATAARLLIPPTAAESASRSDSDASAKETIPMAALTAWTAARPSPPRNAAAPAEADTLSDETRSPRGVDPPTKLVASRRVHDPRFCYANAERCSVSGETGVTALTLRLTGVSRSERSARQPFRRRSRTSFVDSAGQR